MASTAVVISGIFLLSTAVYNILTVSRQVTKELRVSWERALMAMGIIILEAVTFLILVPGYFFYNLFYLFTIAVPIEYTIARVLEGQKAWDIFEDLVHAQRIDPLVKGRFIVSNLMLGISIILIPVNSLYPYIFGGFLSFLSILYWLSFTRSLRKVSNSGKSRDFFWYTVAQFVLFIAMVIEGISAVVAITGTVMANISSGSLQLLEVIFGQSNNGGLLVVLVITVSLFRYVTIRGCGYSLFGPGKSEGVVKFDDVDEKRQSFLAADEM